MPKLFDSLNLPWHSSESKKKYTPRQAGVYGWLWIWPMVSRKFCYKETCVFIYDETMYIFSYTDVLHANIFLHFKISE